MTEFVTVSGAARTLECSTETVRIYERRGLLPAVRTESGWRIFRREDVERFARERAARVERLVRQRADRAAGEEQLDDQAETVAVEAGRV